MARTKRTEAVADSLEGTVEGLALDHFDKEKAAYEARTGEKVEYVPAMPTTRTPLSPKSVESVEPVESADGEESSAEGDE